MKIDFVFAGLNLNIIIQRKFAIELLKNNKASGADGILAEVLKCGGEVLAAELHAVFELCWRTHCLLQHFKDANIITLYKNKGSRQDCNSYQGISLLSVAGKVLSLVFLPRLQVIADRVLPESQCGFRASRSTIDAVFTSRQLQEKFIEQQCPLYVAFIDLTKAFDLITRSGLFAILRLFGCSDTLLSIILKLHDDMHATVHVNGSRSRKASYPRIKQYFCSKLKQKFFAVSQPESANAGSSECKGSFDSVVKDVQHSAVRISKASSVSANSQS